MLICGNRLPLDRVNSYPFTRAPGKADPPGWHASCYSQLQRQYAARTFMSPLENLESLANQISSPLAAIRYALYLAACRCNDDSAVQYLAMADREVAAIAEVLRTSVDPSDATTASFFQRSAA
jgi:hypothetical protein